MTEHQRHQEWSRDHHAGQPAQEPQEAPAPTPGHDTTQEDMPSRQLWSW